MLTNFSTGGVVGKEGRWRGGGYLEYCWMLNPRFVCTINRVLSPFFPRNVGCSNTLPSKVVLLNDHQNMSSPL
jgi:hypothetical protein